MKWSDSSEIVLGLILDNRLSLNAVRPEIFMPPYCDAIKYLQKEDTEIEDLMEKVGVSPIQSAIDMARNINGLGDKDWVRILENSANYYIAGQEMEKLGRKLQKGEDIDWSKFTTIAQKGQKNIGGDFIPLSEVKRGGLPFKKTGFEALDYHLGGLPAIGQIVVGAKPGVGKTTFMADLAACWATTYTNETIAVFSLEMVCEELATRFDEVKHLPKDVQSRILLNDRPMTAEEVINKSATISNLGLVCVDFADLLVRGETTESSMAAIYRTFMLGAKTLRVPLVLLAQLIKTDRKIPRPNDIRWTGLASALAWMVLMLYDPSTSWSTNDDEDEVLPIIEDWSYVIAWKVRGGFRQHKDDSPGAIQIPFRGDKGWHTGHEGRWFSLKKL